MILTVADSSQNEELLRFFHEFSLKGHAEFKIDRNKSFFAPYQIHSEEFKTYCLKDMGKTEAIASFIFRDTFFQNEQARVAIALDLRVTNNRKAILQWSQHFLPVLHDIQKTEEVKYVFSAINMMDKGIINTFIRPRNIKRPMPRYYLYRKFNIVSLHGKFPWAPKPLPHLRIREGSEKNEEALLQYIIRRSQYKPFASVWDMESFKKKRMRMNGLKLSDFLIAFDSKDNVVGCVAPWSASGIQDYIPLSYSLRAHNFRQFLKFAWLLGWSRRLAKPKVSTGLESKLQFRHLTHLFVDNEDIFESLLFESYERCTKNEFLVYTQIDQDYRIAPPKSWLAAKSPYALYCVVPPEEPKPEFLDPSISLNPEIESHLVI